MNTIARQIGETESKLNQHMAIKDSILAGSNWKEKRAELETQLFNLKVKFYDLQIAELEQKKAFLKKEHERKKQ
jgi:hypothetical protein